MLRCRCPEADGRAPDHSAPAMKTAPSERRGILGSSRISGECCADLQEEVILIAVARARGWNCGCGQATHHRAGPPRHGARHRHFVGRSGSVSGLLLRLASPVKGVALQPDEGMPRMPLPLLAVQALQTGIGCIEFLPGHHLLSVVCAQLRHREKPCSAIQSVRIVCLLSKIL